MMSFDKRQHNVRRNVHRTRESLQKTQARNHRAMMNLRWIYGEKSRTEQPAEEVSDAKISIKG